MLVIQAQQRVMKIRSLKSGVQGLDSYLLILGSCLTSNGLEGLGLQIRRVLLDSIPSFPVITLVVQHVSVFSYLLYQVLIEP
jgi:hypothetical protein